MEKLIAVKETKVSLKISDQYTNKTLNYNLKIYKLIKLLPEKIYLIIIQ